MAVDASEEEVDAHSVTVLPEVSITIPQCESPLEFLTLVGPETVKTLQSDGKKNTQTKIDDIEKGKIETPNSSDESVKNEDSFTRALQREISFQIGGRFMQLLMKHTFELPKFITRDKCNGERVNGTTPTNRSRKYKRSASFNSRKVVLLFSVLSIMGTVILIYLTLRVKQFSDGVARA